MEQYLPIPQLERFSLAYKIDETDLPDNFHIHPTLVWYCPTDSGYKNLGKKHLSSVEAEIRKHGITFDLIHTHFTWSAGYVGARLKERYDVPLVVTAHGYDIYSLPFKDEIWKKNIEYVLNMADAIITVSQSNLECIRRLDIHTPVHVIPNGFRNDLFYPRDSFTCRQQLNLPQNKKILLTVGYLDLSDKGQNYLVEAIGKLIQVRNDILCVIIGMGKDKCILENQIQSLGLGKYILLAGGKPHDEIPLWMSACDLFVLPSIRESFGVVQIEALACGKPVVATRNGGSEEIITSEEYGLLVKPADPDDLAKKIQFALDQRWDRGKILAYAERFTWGNIAKEILEVYRQVSRDRK
jgi:glycosyltransferase involved in cell wall biosynthesis